LTTKHKKTSPRVPNAPVQISAAGASDFVPASLNQPGDLVPPSCTCGNEQIILAEPGLGLRVKAGPQVSMSAKQRHKRITTHRDIGGMPRHLTDLVFSRLRLEKASTFPNLETDTRTHKCFQQAHDTVDDLKPELLPTRSFL
jgi:hypothetical protein